MMQRINFFEKCDIFLLFPLPLSEMKNIFFLAISKNWNVRRAILADLKECVLSTDILLPQFLKQIHSITFLF